jgi:hypothetical protein
VPSPFSDPIMAKPTMTGHAMRVVSFLTRAWAVLAFTAAGSGLGLADIVIFTDGKAIQGYVVDRGQAYDVATRYGTLTVQKSDVQKIIVNAAQVVAEAESLRRDARAANDEAMKRSDIRDRARALTSALDILEKALASCAEARAFFPSSAQDQIDAISAELREEMRRFRDKMPADPSATSAANPLPPAPAVNPSDPPRSITPPTMLPPISPPSRPAPSMSSEKLAALARLEGTVKTPEAARAFADHCLRLMDEAVTEGQHDLASRIGARAEAMAHASRDAFTKSRVRDRVREILDIQCEATAIAVFWKILGTRPDDPAANAAIGRFLCFAQENWEKGLPMLAKGSDPNLKALAAKELARPTEIADQVALADAWWEAGEKNAGSLKGEYLDRAVRWYSAAVPRASGLTQVRINNRLTAYDKMFPHRAPVAARQPLQGYGSTTAGGANQPVARVTTLADNGPGSLREALAKGHRMIVFDVAGDVALATPLIVEHPFITIDGLSAPPPGITLRGRLTSPSAPAIDGLSIRGKNAHDIVLRGLRFRGGGGIAIGPGASNVVVDHVSIHHPNGHGLVISGDAHDVTVSWSIFNDAKSACAPAAFGGYRVSVHHNLFAHGGSMSVRAGGEVGPAAPPPSAETTLDFRNNVIWGWTMTGWGLRILAGVRGNVVANLFGAGVGGNKHHAAIVYAYSKSVRIFAALNVTADPTHRNPNAISDEIEPLSSATVNTTSAFSAARSILASAGARPLDTADEELLRSVVILQR